jgi:hypothetical protein
MTRLRRSSVALALATTTAFAGAAAVPAVADTARTSAPAAATVAEAPAASADLPTGSATGSSPAANCGENASEGVTGSLPCAAAVGSSAGLAAVLFGALRTLVYNIFGF